MKGSPRPVGLLVVALIATLAIAIPVMGADPSPSVDASPSTEPSASADASSSAAPSPSVDASPSAGPSDVATPPAETETPATAPETVTPSRPDRTPDPVDESDTKKGPKGDDQPEVTLTVTGIVQQATDGKGRPSFTLTAGTTTWELSAGPPWFWGDNNPLKPFVGKIVAVGGSTEGDSTELEVETVNGSAIRAPGKPPWAGGPWVVGPTHPGWKPWMADGKPGKHKKDKSADPTETAQPAKP